MLGRTIRGIREHHGLNTGELAAATGLAPACITAIEDGQLDPDFELLLQLAEGMGIRPSAFFLHAEELGNEDTKRSANI